MLAVVSKVYLLIFLFTLVPVYSRVTSVDALTCPEPAGSVDWSNTSTGLIPLTDLGAGTWNGHTGGLYPNGSNTIPSDHLQAGLEMVNSIQPRDAAGNPDANGSIVLFPIGFSNTWQEFETFVEVAQADPELNPNLVVVNTARGGSAAEEWANPADPAWDATDATLAGAGVTPNQVAAAWIKLAVGRIEGVHEEQLHGYLRSVVGIAKDRYPNLRLAYFTSESTGATKREYPVANR